tara:strand:+ start:234 stop:419 length:186 start_codon:yes stop_codon:yes gene_type:complete
MDMATALDQLEVHDNVLSSEEKSFLDEKGYLAFPNILSQNQVQRFKEALQAWLKKRMIRVL